MVVVLCVSVMLVMYLAVGDGGVLVGLGDVAVIMAVVVWRW